MREPGNEVGVFYQLHRHVRRVRVIFFVDGKDTKVIRLSGLGLSGLENV